MICWFRWINICSVEPKVGESLGRIRLTAACAAIVLHPVETITRPVAHREDHLRDVAGHGWQVRATIAGWIHDNLIIALSQGHSIACEDIIAIY